MRPEKVHRPGWPPGELYLACKWAHEHADELRAEYRRRLAERLAATQHLDDRSLRQARTAMRRRLRVGEITPAEYQRWLKPQKELNAAYKGILATARAGAGEYARERRGAPLPDELVGGIVAGEAGPR
ncbi:MAG: hypothetical protein NTW87_05830 [Planctomycetota bacterium]|nr:hypothetical protein [Planctomycetota bacterium]